MLRIALLSVVLVFALVACGGSEPAQNAPAEQAAPVDQAVNEPAQNVAEEPEQDVAEEPAEEVAEEPEAEGVTLAMFDQLENGMTYEEVVAILGSEGTVMSESDLAGITTVMYMWEGTMLTANMNAMFQDGEMMQKSQFGLE